MKLHDYELFVASSRYSMSAEMAHLHKWHGTRHVR